jgi:hypothetical protein
LTSRINLDDPRIPASAVISSSGKFAVMSSEVAGKDAARGRARTVESCGPLN